MGTVAIRPVERRSAEAQAVDALRDAIVSGALPQGERVTEFDLAARLHISRATVRAALQMLAAEQLVVQVPYTGWRIISLSPADVWEIFTLRASLEGLAGRLSAERLRCNARGGADLKETFNALKKACKKGSQSAISEADFTLHETVVLLSEHRRLSEQYRRLHQQVRLFINASDALVADPDVIVSQHAPIVDAILGGHAEDAARLSEQHNLLEGEKLMAFARVHAEQA